MPKLVCDQCGREYNDTESIEMAKKGAEVWQKMCKADGVEARGLAPCPIITCHGELVLKE